MQVISYLEIFRNSRKWDNESVIEVSFLSFMLQIIML